MLYAANPVPFTSGVPFPTGVAASPDLLLVSEYCTENIDTGRLQRECYVVRDLPGVWFLPGKIHDYRSSAVREFREPPRVSPVHPARRFRHRRRFGLQGP